MPDNCQLRPVAPDDAERMLRWLLDPEVADNFGMRLRPTLSSIQQWIEKASLGQETHAWAIHHRGAHVGNVMLDCIDTFLQSARLSIYRSGTMNAESAAAFFTLAPGARVDNAGAEPPPNTPSTIGGVIQKTKSVGR